MNKARVDQLVIDTLALAEVELRERIADLEADVDAYRAVACAALDRVAALTETLDHQRERIAGLVEEIRRYVAAQMEERAA